MTRSVFGEEELWSVLADTSSPILLYGTGDGADKILSVMEKMILKAREKSEEPIILSTFFMDLDKNEFMRYHVDEINALYKKLAEKYSVGYIDIQSAIDGWISKASSYILSSDRVHPKAIGVSLIARTIFEHPVFRRVIDR